jgi:hypothetical protein
MFFNMQCCCVLGLTVSMLGGTVCNIKNCCVLGLVSLQEEAQAAPAAPQLDATERALLAEAGRAAGGGMEEEEADMDVDMDVEEGAQEVVAAAAAEEEEEEEEEDKPMKIVKNYTRVCERIG